MSRRQVPVGRIYIHEHRQSAYGMHAQEVSRIIVRRQYDFIAGADLERPQSKLDRKGPAATGERELHAVVLAQRAFELLDISTGVLSPGAVGVGDAERSANIVIENRPGRRTAGSNRRATQKCRQVGVPHQ